MENILFWILMMPMMVLLFMGFINMFRKKTSLDLRKWERQKYIQKVNENQYPVKIDCKFKIVVFTILGILLFSISCALIISAFLLSKFEAVFFSILCLVFLLMILKKLFVLYRAVFVTVTVTSIVEEVYDDSEDHYDIYKILVDYIYLKKEFKDICWYSLNNHTTRLTIDDLPRKGQRFKLLVHPDEPTKILSRKPRNKELNS